MRDLLFKNLTSVDRKRKVVSTSETMENQGIRSVIRRHFVCMMKEVMAEDMEKKPSPYLYVLKIRNAKEQKEKFFCRIKGSVYAINKGRIFLIVFAHSLKVDLAATTHDLAGYKEDNST
ncbi:MAG: hypothetical protein WC723_03715 [Candidatus Omnitrophota bacterium]